VSAGSAVRFVDRRRDPSIPLLSLYRERVAAFVPITHARAAWMEATVPVFVDMN
jgi:hypothetical protein